MKKFLRFFGKYRGFRVRDWYKHQRLIVTFVLFSPILFGIGSYVYFHDVEVLAYLQENMLVRIPLALGVLFVLFLVVLKIEIEFEKYLVFFTRLRSLYFLRRKMFYSKFYNTVKRENKPEKIKFERAYLRQNKHTVEVSFELRGTKSEQKFLQLGPQLETTFSGDLMEQQILDGYIIYTIAFQKYLGRISVDRVEMTPKGLCLMETVYWDFRKEPHLLISGGTGGGKSVLLFILILALAKFSNLYICDPKRADLANLERYDVFQGQVYFEVPDIVNCVINAWKMMNKRYDYMRQSPQNKMGLDYSDYGMKPTFIIIDEVGAMTSELEGMRGSRLAAEYFNALQQIAQKGRQAGIFLILSLQKAGVDAVPSNIRDQLMKRITVGVLSGTGYTIAFGEEASQKEFKTIKEIDGRVIRGRGYTGNFGEIIEEFYSPYVPFDQGFDFFEEYAKLPKLELADYDRIVQPEVKKKSKPSEVSDDQTYSREKLAKALGTSPTVVQRATQLLADSGIYFDKDIKGRYSYGDQDKDFLASILAYKRDERVTLSKAIEQFVQLDEDDK